MENDIKETYTVSKPRRWHPALVGCLVFVVIILASFAVMLSSFYKIPYAKNLAECKSRIEQTGAALERYYTKHDAYPDSLSDLVPDYIPVSTLHCTTYKSSEDSSSYIYNKPEPKSPGGFIMLTCDHHRISSKLKSRFPGAVIHYRKDGNITITPVPENRT